MVIASFTVTQGKGDGDFRVKATGGRLVNVVD
jgi:hypothetical protein